MDSDNNALITSDSPESTIIDRIRYLIHLSHSNQRTFARRIGMDAANFSKVLSGNLKTSDTFLNRLVVELGVSKHWLLTGEGVPYDKNADTTPRIITDVPVIQERVRPGGTPVYDIDVTAGVTELSRMFTRENIMGYIDYPKLDPKNVVVKVTGDSMTPVIDDGAMLAIRPVSHSGVILWGHIYVIVLEDYRLVKYVHKNADPSMITLHSANRAYDDIDLSRRDIVALYYVDVVMNYKYM